MTSSESGPNSLCTICGYVVAGPAPPPHCPECRARDGMFAPTSESPHGVPHNPFQPRDHESFAEVVGPGVRGCVDSE